MKRLQVVVAMIVLVFQFTVTYAEQESMEQKCTQWVNSYIYGLEIGKPTVSRYPSLENSEKKGLTRAEIEKLQKKMSDCEVKEAIMQALMNK